ncbi:MAG: histidine kinase [Opitutaceae bacterium]|jgi:signal transduction histidine kinase
MKPARKTSNGATAVIPDIVTVNRQHSLAETGTSRAGALRIVLVEDSEPDVELIQRALLASGLDFTMTTVETRERFEAELSHQSPGIILSDFFLPRFDGSAALEIAMQLAPGVPFIFVTGVLGEEVVIEMMKKGATDYVLKSRLARLVPAVNRALRETEQRRENQKSQERLRRSHDQLRALTGHLRFVREEERTRIAREVHDELGQALTGLKLDLSWLSGKVAGKRALQRKISAMSAQVDTTIQTVRRIATELRPGVLDNLGLAAAIEWQTMDFQERTGIRCVIKMDLKETIWDREFGTMCFRIFQETLTNIVRHAKATRVDISLTQIDHELVMTVSDNGRGISEKDVIHARSIGLIGMRERVAQAGGQVFFFGLPARGTTVTMRVPMPTAAANNPGSS